MSDINTLSKSSLSIPEEVLLELADIQKRFAELYRKYSGVAAIADYGVQLMSDSLIETFGEYEVADKSGSFEMLTANFSGTMFFAVRELPS